jgi:predicted GH43/DUF377 family glycosyl hydrolase
VVKPEELGLVWEEEGKERKGAVFNAGAEVFQEQIVLTPRCHQNYQQGKFFDQKLQRERYCLLNYVSEIWPLLSKDGICFKKIGSCLRGDGSTQQDFTYGIEDVRIFKWQDEYLLVGCGKVKPAFKGVNADRVAIYSTSDFTHLTYHGMIDAFDSRNAILLPDEKNPGLILRFHPHIYLIPLKAGIEQLKNPARFKEEWRRIYQEKEKYLLMKSGDFLHEKEKIGPSTQLVKTKAGWLFLYHAVGEIKPEIVEVYGGRGKLERSYSIEAALLSLEEPRKVLARTKNPIYIPSHPYELTGDEKYLVDVPYVIFPVGAVVVGEKLFIYAGAGDKYIVLLSCQLDLLVEYLWEKCREN